MSLQAENYDHNRGLDYVGVDVIPSGPKTMAEELQKVRGPDWVHKKRRDVVGLWKSKTAYRDMGRPDLSAGPLAADQLSGINSFSESQPIDPVRVPSFRPSDDLHLSLQPLQEWEGYVIHVGLGSFKARLIDITNNKPAELEEARFLIMKVPEVDRRHIEVGAVFRLIVGHKRLPDGKRSKASKIFFRKRPNHSKFDLDQAKKAAKSIVEGIDWE